MGTAKMSYPSLAPYIMKRPWLMRWMRPLSEWYFDNAGYRKLGLRADDLIPEEDEIVQQALKRLSPKEAYDRVFRMRRAFQCSLSHQLLPQTEREDLESMIINKRKATPKGSSPNIESKH